MISYRLIEFLNEYKHLIMKNDFDNLYEEANKANINIPDLTSLLLESDINPLLYFKDSIPNDFAEGLTDDLDFIRNLVIPNNIKYIGNSAFRDAEVNSVIFSDSVIEIGHDAFSNTFIENLDLSNIKYVGEATFANNFYLRDIILPYSKTSSIGIDAFYNMNDEAKIHYKYTKEEYLEEYYSDFEGHLIICSNGNIEADYDYDT